VPPVLRPVGQAQTAIVGLAADAAQIAQLFQAPQWGIYDRNGSPVLASSSTVAQIVNSVAGTLTQIGSLFGFSGSASFACSVGSLDFRQDYRISTAPQEQGSFLSYNKVQDPFAGRVTFLVGGNDAQRSAFLATVAALVASISLFALVMPEMTYPSVNCTHFDFRRTARSGVSLLAVDVWVEQVRITGTTQYTATPSGADPVNAGAVQPVSPNDVSGSSGGAPVSAFVPAGALT
jgi:hypothetical protein